MINGTDVHAVAGALALAHVQQLDSYTMEEMKIGLVIQEGKGCGLLFLCINYYLDDKRRPYGIQ